MANKNDISRKTLKYYAKMASETYVDDPVYKFACKNVAIRKRFIYFRCSNSNR